MSVKWEATKVDEATTGRPAVLPERIDLLVHNEPNLRLDAPEPARIDTGNEVEGFLCARKERRVVALVVIDVAQTDTMMRFTSQLAKTVPLKSGD